MLLRMVCTFLHKNRHIHHPPRPWAPPHPTADLVTLSSSSSGGFRLHCTSSTCFRLPTIEYSAVRRPSLS